jgi:cellulose synthase/poly-beta-1,6-N-acetylglucosamine synthase-like glycosyltransferase
MVAKFDSRTAMVIGFCHLNVRQGAIQGFLAFDNLVSGLLNGTFAHLGYPISCSGGNMAFRKSSFHDVGGFDSIRRHKTGEDTHLAQLFHKRRTGKIRYCLCAEGNVNTHAPTRFREIFHRMIRVNSETFKMNAAQILLRLAFLAAYLAPFALVFNGSRGIGLALIAVRFLLEHLFLRSGAVKLRRRYPVLPNFIYQALYPVYLVAFGLFGAARIHKWR